MFNDTLHIEFIKHTFNIIPNGAEHIHKKKVMLYNTSNIHENVTLLLLIPKYMFFV
jgi:hypothetical protein